jgi:hypothetical protein
VKEKERKGATEKAGPGISKQSSRVILRGQWSHGNEDGFKPPFEFGSWPRKCRTTCSLKNNSGLSLSPVLHKLWH